MLNQPSIFEAANIEHTEIHGLAASHLPEAPRGLPRRTRGFEQGAPKLVEDQSAGTRT